MSDTKQPPAATPVPEPQTPPASATPVPTPAPTPKPVVTEPPATPKPTSAPLRSPAPTKPPQVTPAVVIPESQPHPTPTVVSEAVLSQPNVAKPPIVPEQQASSDNSRPSGVTVQIVSVVTEHLANYRTYLSALNPTTKSLRGAAATLATVVKIALKTPTPEVLEIIWDFFVANKTGVLQERSALQGVESLDKPTRAKVEIFYTLVRQAVNGVDVGSQTNVRLDVTQASLQCPQLLVFLQQKAKTVANATSASK